MTDQWMIYGANGYTGELTARLAVARGKTPILAGRSASKVEDVAGELGLQSRIFDLRETSALLDALEDVRAVLHAAGPFSSTAEPMVDACLATGTHYLDITGEIDVFEAIFARHEDAQKAAVSLIPGVGFDVVPTDCLSGMVARQLPDATELSLAVFGLTSRSAGTTKTLVEGAAKRGRARIDGAIQTVPAVWRTRSIPFFDKERMAVTIPWGDVSTAYRSTGIPNISTYFALPPSYYRWMRRADRARFILGLGPVQRLLKALVGWRVDGPDESTRENARSELWAEVVNPDGKAITATMTTPEGYSLTADSALRAVGRVLEGDVPAGALTPSQAFGPDFVRELDGVVLH